MHDSAARTPALVWAILVVIVLLGGRAVTLADDTPTDKIPVDKTRAEHDGKPAKNVSKDAASEESSDTKRGRKQEPEKKAEAEKKSEPDKRPEKKPAENKGSSDKRPAGKASSDRPASGKPPQEKSSPDKDTDGKSAPQKSNTQKPSTDKSAPDKSKSEKSNSGKLNPAKPSSEKVGERKGEERPLAITAGREAAAMTFARVHHPELADLLEQLKKGNKAEYERAIRDLFQTSEKLAKIKERSPDRYEAAVADWKVDSRIRLLSARMMMSENPSLEAELRDLLRQRAESRIRELKEERQRIASRMERIDEELSALESDPTGTIQRELQKVRVQVSEQLRNLKNKNVRKTEPAAVD